MTGCEICHKPRSRIVTMINYQRFHIVEHLEEGDLPPINHARLWVCTDCYQDLLARNPEVIDRFIAQPCDQCGEYVNQRYGYQQFTIDRQFCAECMVKLAGIKFNYPLSIRRGVRGLMGDIEFKGEDCYIWDPFRLIMKREGGRETTIDVETEGEIRGDLPLREGASPHMLGPLKHVFIRDGKVIWIAKNCNVSEVSIDTGVDYIFGHYDGPHTPVSNGCNKVRFKMFVEDIEFKLEEDIERERQSRANIIAERAIAELTNATAILSQPYYDADDRLFVWCTCGFQDKFYARDGDSIQHEYMSIMIPQLSTGGSISHNCGLGHILHIVRSVSPPNQQELEDLR